MVARTAVGLKHLGHLRSTTSIHLDTESNNILYYNNSNNSDVNIGNSGNNYGDDDVGDNDNNDDGDNGDDSDDDGDSGDNGGNNDSDGDGNDGINDHDGGDTSDSGNYNNSNNNNCYCNGQDGTDANSDGCNGENNNINNDDGRIDCGRDNRDNSNAYTINNGIPDNIKGLYLNIRSIRSNFSELKSIIYSENFDIVALTETFINTDRIDLPTEYNIPGYKFFHKDRKNSRGGGVGLYIKEMLHPTEIEIIQDHNIEVLNTEISTVSGKVNISVVYRRPSQVKELDILMYDRLKTVITGKNSIIMGDFNLPEINWNDHSFVESESGRLINFIEDNFLFQFVKEPTRNHNILDLIMSNQEHLINHTEVCEQLGTGDHNMIKFAINNQIRKVKEKLYVPNFSKADFIGLRNALGKVNLKGESTDELWTNFKDQVLYQQKKYIPLCNKNVDTRNTEDWYGPNISRAIRNRNRLYKMKKYNPNPQVTMQYNNARREVKKQIRQAKREHEINIANESKTNPKKFYRYINNRKHIKSGIGPLLNEAGETITDDKKMATTLNNYFSTVFTTNNNKSNKTEDIIKTRHSIPNLHVTEKQVLKKLEKMKINKSPGPDNFYPRILKNIKEQIARPLTDIFNSSLQQGIVPQDWKQANVTPIFKKGCRKQPGNYRPISLTSVICKLLESIIKDNVVKFLDKHNLIRSTQHGFCKNKSCLTNLIEFYNKLLHQHDSKKSLDIIYLDFQKAFDKVPHDKLMIKVRALGISGNIGNWIESWLQNREQRVVINGHSSNWSPVTSGVPQGSVLGPILFIIYINDLDVGLNNFITKFADDTKIGNAVITEEERLLLQQDLNKIAEWSENWNMPFNVNKCQLLQIGSQNKKYDYEIMGQQIKSVNQAKDLGVIISQNLKFSQHTNEAVKKANRMLGFINRNFTFKNKDIILPLYRSLVRPHLEYAVQFWDPHLIKDINKLESVQRRATKLIPSLRNKAYEDRLRELDLFSLTKRRLRGKLIECFKILKGFNNIMPEALFTLAPELPTRGNSLKLRGHRVNLDITKYFFTNDIVDKWNSLPDNVVRSTSIDMFKDRLDRHLSDVQ